MHSSEFGDRAPQDIIAIFHASFHPTKGSIIDWSLKASEDLDLSHVEFSCLPSGLHLIERDVVYFTKDDHQGVCVFRRRQTTEHGHRGFRLSSLGILLAKSPRPRPWQHVAALKTLVNTIYSALEDREALEPLDEDWQPARAFFEERKLRRPDLGGVGSWLGWNAELEGTRSDTSPTVHLPHLLRILGPSSLTLYKHILGRRRVLIITLPPVEAACILCQVAADTCYQEQVSELVSAQDGQDGDEDSETPRRIKGRSNAGVKVLGMVTLNDVDKLEFESKTGRGWIACTTDSIFLDKPAYYDLLIDLRSATPNTRPTFHISKSVEQPNGRGVSYRLSSVRFTWSDVRLWTELERVLQLDSEDSLDTCCDPSTHTAKGPLQHGSSWTDVWRVYEDVCVMCAGLWMGAWRSSTSYPGSSRRNEFWGSIRLEGEDDLSLRTRSTPHVRHVGLGIEGRPSGGTVPPGSGSRTPRALRRASTMSAWTWSGGKSGDAQEQPARPTTEDAPTPSGGMFIPGARNNVPEPGPRDDAAAVARRERQVLTTLALLDTFHTNTTAILSRLATLLETRKAQQQQQQCSRRADSNVSTALAGGTQTVLFTPKDVLSFELGPFSGLDARFVEWLGEEYGGGMRVLVKRGWKDLFGLILGFG
ncbi:hypothetical protein PYCCODRAFT_1435621 [Trametes coccinea BRFM310]|uniref:UDENN domain-containing protein n=1 Tax=Trametes coccinea (strain BRFM310) TaxID=1353009 RepID=A0A1Y2IMF6_TRAC3|nr:hypothetical protein PYCCODRAFT_1435621 [Trametes coccinea BRFM310]